MKIKNYKDIRTKPLIFGFSFSSGIIFLVVLIITLFPFIDGFSRLKVIIFIVINCSSFLICKFLFGEINVLEELLNEKFPNELNDFTRDEK